MDNPEKLATLGIHDTEQINVREYRGKLGNKFDRPWNLQKKTSSCL
jgi:hypothetical protein